jgi:hypothetical protein
MAASPGVFGLATEIERIFERFKEDAASACLRKRLRDCASWASLSGKNFRATWG